MWATEKKFIAWGTSKLLELYVSNTADDNIILAVDGNKYDSRFAEKEIHNPIENEILRSKKYPVVIFAVSNNTIKQILAQLHLMGYALGDNVFLYSDIFIQNYSEKVKTRYGWETSEALHSFVKTAYLSIDIPIHTTILGNMMLIQAIHELSCNKKKLNVAEIGAYRGGNSLLTLLNNSEVIDRYDIIDSFEGFPNLAKYDPAKFKKGDYNVDCTFEEIKDLFASYNNTRVIKGFVPEVFDKLDKNDVYDIVFYDCDLYQPALDTFEYYWSKIVQGGYMIVHDYCTETGGFEGVKKATDEFYKKQITSYWENTMAVIVKE